MSNTWDSMGALPSSDIGTSGGAVVAGDKIWTFAYSTTTYIWSVWSWDPTNGWVAKTSSPTGTAANLPGVGARRRGNWIYLMNAVSSLICRYNWTTDTWDTTGGTLNYLPASTQTVENYGSAVYDDKLFVFGGRIDTNTYYSRAQIYDLVNGGWTVGAAASGNMSANAWSCVVYEDKVHMMQAKPGRFDNDTNAHFVYDPVLDTWTTDTAYAGGGVSEAGWTTDGDGGHIWGVGGHSITTATRYFGQMQPGGAWTTSGTLALHPASSGTHFVWLVRLGDYLYALGGSFTVGADDDFYRYTSATPLVAEAETGAAGIQFSGGTVAGTPTHTIVGR